jgi:hypothetical protein
MAWSNWPSGISRTDKGDTYFDIQVWSWLVQAWLAMRERHSVSSNNLIWPPPDDWGIFSSGSVDTVFDNGDGTMTVTPGSGYVSPGGGSGCSTPRFAPGYNCGECLPNIPSTYDLIITTDATNADPFQVYRGTITAQSDTTFTITSQTILNCITAGYLASLTTLNGATFYILKSGSLWTSERLPDKPDPQAVWIGTSSIGGTVTISGVTYSTLVDTTAAWPNFVNGSTHDELLVFGSDGALHRLMIAGNSPQLIWFAQQAFTVSGDYKVVAPGVVGLPGRTIVPIWQYYAGYSTNYYSHLTDGKNDSIGGYPIAGAQAPTNEGDVCSSGCAAGPNAILLDGDLFISNESTCDGQSAGTFYQNGYWKSFHAIQKDIEGLCSSYLPYMDYTGQEFINLWTTATFFLANSINAWTCGYSAVDSSNLTISGTPTGIRAPSYPISVYYALYNADGSVTGGKGTLTSATNLQGGSFPTSSPLPTSVCISLAWSRYRERHLLYMWNKSGFIPSLDDGTIYDPPAIITDPDTGAITCEVGTWEKRLKSTCYKTRQVNGQAVEGTVAFVDGEKARWVGDNANGPGIYPSTQVGAANAALVPYFDKFYRGTYGSQIQGAKDAAKTGVITGWQASNRAITDSLKNWWVDGVNGSFVSTASGTIGSIVEATNVPPALPTLGSCVATVSVPDSAISCTFVVVDGSGFTVLAGSSGVTPGSSTTLTGNFLTSMDGYTVTLTFQGFLHTEQGTITSATFDSITDSAHDVTCYFQPGRFLGFTGMGAYCEFILQVDHGGVAYKMPVTGSTNTSGVTMSFDSMGVTFSTGDTWAIIEPAYEVNRFQDRLVTIYDNNSNTIYTATAQFSDSNTLFCGQVYLDGEPVTISPALDGSWTYSIFDPETNGVWQWSAETSIWSLVTGGSDVARFAVASPHDFLPANKISRNLPTVYKDYGAMQPDDFTTGILFSEVYHAINSMIATTNPASWTNQSCLTCAHENNYGASFDEDYTTGTFAASLGGAQSMFVWGTPLDGTPPSSNGSCYYDNHWGVGLEGVYAYEKTSGYSQAFSAAIDFYAFSPKIADFCFCSAHISDSSADPVPPSCDNYSSDYPCVLITGEEDWTGGTVAGLEYGLWTKISSDDNSQSAAFSRSVGDQEPQLVIDPIALLGYEDLTGGLGAGYTVTNQLAIMKWSFTYVG